MEKLHGPTCANSGEIATFRPTFDRIDRIYFETKLLKVLRNLCSSRSGLYSAQNANLSNMIMSAVINMMCNTSNIMEEYMVGMVGMVGMVAGEKLSGRLAAIGLAAIGPAVPGAAVAGCNIPAAPSLAVIPIIHTQPMRGLVPVQLAPCQSERSKLQPLAICQNATRDRAVTSDS